MWRPTPMRVALRGVRAARPSQQPPVHVRCFSSAVESMGAFVAHATNGLLSHARNEWSDGTAQPAARGSQLIHSTAVVHPSASIGERVRIGPFTVVGPDVTLMSDVELKSHVVVDGATVIGSGTVVHPFACLGEQPQDKKHQGTFDDSSCDGSDTAPTLVVGRNCVIREHVTIHGRTSYSTEPTRVGDECWILCGAHIGHDAQIGRRVVLSNNVCVAGHVDIGDFAIVGGQVGLKQHIKIGSLAMIGGKSAVDGDVLPYGMAVGNRAKIAGLNLIGLRRAKVSRQEIKLMLRVYRYLFGTHTAHGSPRCGFAPPLDLPHKDALDERAQLVRNYLLDQGLEMERVVEMVQFVLDAPNRPRSALCAVTVATTHKPSS